MSADRTEKRGARKIAAKFDWPYTKALRALRAQIYVIQGDEVERGVNWSDDWR